MQNRFPLPNDIFFSLLSLLPIQDILNLSSISKDQHKIISTPGLWKQLEMRDFYFASNSTDSKACYMNKKLGIAREKQRYIDYMTALCHITVAVEQEHDYPTLPDATRQDRKKNAIKKQLDSYAMQSDTDFESAYKKLTASVENKQLVEIRTHWNEFYTLFMSTDIETWLLSLANNNDQKKNTTEIEDRKIRLLFEIAFLPLCKLDAHLSLNILINKQNFLSQNAYLLFAFNYPCKNTILHLLNTKIDLNEKNWVIDGSVRMHITPIMFAVLGMLECKQLNTYKEMISQLLQHGADTKLKVFITDDDWKSEDEYDQRSKPIDEWCQYLLDNKMDKLKSKSDKNIFKETMLMIINHKPEKDVNLSQCWICSIQ